MRRALGVLIVLALTALPVASPSRAQLDPTARIAEVDRQLAETLSSVERAEAEKARVDAEIAGLAEGRAAANRRLHERTRALYRLTRAGVLPLAGGFDALLTHVARVERLERMVQRDLDALRELRERGEILRAETGRLAAEIEQGRATATRLRTDRQVAEEQARSASVFASAFGEGPVSGPPDGVLVGSDAAGWVRVVDPQPTARASAFESQHGRLALPVAAPREMREASSAEGPALELDAAMGAPVRCAASGRVAFARRHPQYGELVIVDHGGGWFSVYGGLGRIDVSEGDDLARAMHIGVTSMSPVFFQVRRGTRAVEPRSWLGI